MNGLNKKGLVGGIQKFSTEDGPGIRTTVFLKGCPLDCRWCHNPELIETEIQLMRCPNNCIGCGECARTCPRKAILFSDGQISIDWDACDRCMKCADACWPKALNAAGTWMTAEEVLEQVQQDKGFYQHTGGGMTISGGELLAQPEFTEALLDAAAEKTIGVVLDTSGHGSSKTLLKLANHKACTHILYDMKHIDSEAHKRYTGLGNELILENLKVLAEDPSVNAKVIMRMPLISGVNDSEEDIGKAACLFSDLSLKAVTLLPYHELGVSKRRNIGGEPEVFRAPSKERIREISSLFENCCIRVEVLGE